LWAILLDVREREFDFVRVNNNNNIHICIAPYGRNFRGAEY